MHQINTKWDQTFHCQEKYYAIAQKNAQENHHNQSIMNRSETIYLIKKKSKRNIMIKVTISNHCQELTTGQKFFS